MKKICILLMIIMLLTITGCSKKQVNDMNYTFKGENEFWAAEFQVKGTGTSSQNLFGQINFDSDLNKTLIVTYKKDISQLSSVKHLEISYEEIGLKGKTLIEDYNNGSQARKTYTLKSHTTGSSVETGDSIIKVTINIDNQIQTIDLNNEQLYYGTWIIKKYVPTTNVSSLSEKNINDYIGQKIIIDENQIVTNQGTIKNPIFEKKTLTSPDFFNEWKVQFSSLLIFGNTVTQVKVSNYKNETRDGIGSNFIFYNNKTYTNIGGCFFELEK